MKQAESEQLIRDCRELMTNRMRSSMSRMMGDIEDTLFEMATGGKAPDPVPHPVSYQQRWLISRITGRFFRVDCAWEIFQSQRYRSRL